MADTGVFSAGPARRESKAQQLTELIPLVKQGDLEALDKLMSTLIAFLRGHSITQVDQRLRARLDPSDLIQTSLLEVYRDLERFRGASDKVFLAWLISVVRHNANEAVNRHIQARRRTVSREVPLESFRSPEDSVDPGVPDARPSPSSLLRRRESEQHVRDKIDELPVRYRQAVRLHHLHGWTVQQIADYTEQSTAAVAGLLRRGVKALARLLETPSES